MILNTFITWKYHNYLIISNLSAMIPIHPSIMLIFQKSFISLLNVSNWILEILQMWNVFSIPSDFIIKENIMPCFFKTCNRIPYSPSIHNIQLSNIIGLLSSIFFLLCRPFKNEKNWKSLFSLSVLSSNINFEKIFPVLRTFSKLCCYFSGVSNTS